jgi:hypothetical protein
MQLLLLEDESFDRNNRSVRHLSASNSVVGSSWVI